MRTKTTEEKAPSPRKKISIVMPACNEEGNIPRAYDELLDVFNKMPAYDFEVIIIDNASDDRTGDRALELCAKDDRWKYVRFSRNFGAETSITVGMGLASGDAAINVFSDLQDPPEKIPEFIRKWEEGYDVVYGVIQDRGDSWAMRGLFARAAYRLIRYFSDISIPVNAGDFRLLDRKVIDAFKRMGERERFVRGMVHWVGFKKHPLPYNRRKRQWGKSKAPYWWCYYFTLNAITSFSTKPLRLFTLFGLIVLLLSLGLSVWYIIGKWVTSPPHGVTSTLVLLCWNLTVLSLGVGLLGEYIGHIYVETKRRPLFFIDGFQNFDQEEIDDVNSNFDQ